MKILRFMAIRKIKCLTALFKITVACKEISLPVSVQQTWIQNLSKNSNSGSKSEAILSVYLLLLAVKKPVMTCNGFLNVQSQTMKGRHSGWLTFVILMLWTNLFLLPAYIICSPGWQPGQNTRHVKRVSGSASSNRALRSLPWRRFPYPLDWRRWSTRGRTRVRHRACTCSCRQWTLAMLRTHTHPGRQLRDGAPPAVVKTESWERISGLSLRQLFPQVVWRNVLETHRQTPSRPHVICINHLFVTARGTKGFSPRPRGDRFCHLSSPRAPRR